MKRTILLGALLVGFAVMAVAQNKNDIPLGDVVRQQKPTKKASRVITNEEIPSRPEEPAATPDTTASTSAAAPATDAGTADGKAAPATGTVAKPATSGDSPEVAAIKGRLKEVISDELHLSSQIKDIEGVMAREQDPDRRKTLANMLDNQKRSLQRRQDEHADLNRKLEQAQKPK